MLAGGPAGGWLLIPNDAEILFAAMSTPRRRSRRLAAARSPAVLSEVLLSPDLVPHILAQLPTNAHAVKGTCRAWRRGWKETLAKRERPRLVVIGGNGSDGPFISSMFISSVERYDPSTNEWEGEAVAPMPTAREKFGTAVLDGKLYAAGGMNEADGATSNLVERYDPATKAWEAVEPLAAARGCVGLAVLDGKLYAVGGFNNGALSSVERYDAAANAWEAVAPLASARVTHAVAVLDGKLYAVGGYNEHDGALSSVERYDAAANAWEAVAPLASARFTQAVAVLDGKLYAVGGYNGGHLSSVERYGPALNAWEAVAPMAAARALAAAAVLDGKLYAVGGRGLAAPLSSVERYDAEADAWEAVAPMAAARVDGSLFDGSLF